MENIDKKPVGQIVAEDFRTWPVFESHKIDYYNKGRQSLQDVTNEHKIDLQLLINEITEKKETQAEADPDFNSWPLDDLSEYII